MRTFTEEQAKAVFARAARDQQAALEAADAGAGLTLEELQEIGRASGLAPAFVAAAAQAVALGEAETHRGRVGPVPVAVGHTVRLATPASDDAWARLVADARRTFRAKGHTAVDGAERMWRNGNLRMTLVPDGDGSRLELATRRNEAWPLTVLAVAFVSAGWLLTRGGPLAGTLLVLAAVIGAALAAVWAQQHGWATTRARQMRDVADRAASPATRPPSLSAPLASAFEASATDERDAPAADAAGAAPRRTPS